MDINSLEKNEDGAVYAVARLGPVVPGANNQMAGF